MQTTFSHVESNYGVNTTVCTSACQASGGCGSPAHFPQPGAIEQIPTRGRPCHSFVGFIAWPCWLMQPGLAVDTAMWRPSCVLGGPACRDGALWLEEVWLGWMSTVHRAEGTRGLTATPLSQSPLTHPPTHLRNLPLVRTLELWHTGRVYPAADPPALLIVHHCLCVEKMVA